MNKYLMIIGIMIAAGCNNGTDKTNNRDSTSTSGNTTAPGNNIPAIAGCYMQILARDTFAADLQQQGNRITGKLSFDNYEKDGSTGTVTGKLEDHVLKLYYFFASEGMNSVMEVWFKYEEGKLLRGTGNMDNRGDTAYFINPAEIKYDGGTLLKIPCEDLPAKYK